MPREGVSMPLFRFRCFARRHGREVIRRCALIFRGGEVAMRERPPSYALLRMGMRSA